MKNIIDWFRSLGFPGLSFWVPVLVWAGLTLWVSFFGDDRFFSPTAFQLWEGVWWGALTHAFWSPSLLSAGMQILAFAIFIWVLDRPLQRVLTSLVYAVTMAYALVVLMAPFLLQFLGATTVLGFLWLRILLKEPSLVRGQGLGKWSAVLAGWLLFSAEMELRGHLFGPDSLWSLAMAMGLILGMCTALFLRISTWLWRTQNRPIPLGVLWGVSLSSLAFWVVLTLEPRTDYGMMWRFDRGDRSEPVMQWVEAVLKNPTSGFRDQLVQRSLFDNNVPGLPQSKVLDSVLKRLDSVDVSLKSSVLL
jgi:hypothetical protein